MATQQANGTNKGIEKLDPSKINESLNSQHLRGETTHGISKEDGFAFMETLQPDKLQELTSEYFNFEKKGSYYFIFLGMSKAEIDGKTIDVVMLEDKEQRQLINGNAVLVNSLKKVQNLPTYVRVDYIDDQRSGQGTYKNLKVYTFPMDKK